MNCLLFRFRFFSACWKGVWTQVISLLYVTKNGPEMRDRTHRLLFWSQNRMTSGNSIVNRACQMEQRQFAPPFVVDARVGSLDAELRCGRCCSPPPSSRLLPGDQWRVRIPSKLKHYMEMKYKVSLAYSLPIIILCWRVY